MNELKNHKGEGKTALATEGLVNVRGQCIKINVFSQNNVLLHGIGTTGNQGNWQCSCFDLIPYIHKKCNC